MRIEDLVLTSIANLIKEISSLFSQPTDKRTKKKKIKKEK